jgi:hypothetical protein
MKNMVRYLFLLMLAILLAASGGCERKQEAPAQEASNVEATQAYRTFFGEPPTVAEGARSISKCNIISRECCNCILSAPYI